ncbi:ECF transporter S component [Nocardia fusca]|jgi:energy-coupling factor transport system substrate-specific component|uniref:ECF transporter S component n=1 Tax=Nocardia fusca TaxID=941183 RepID=A0ABV3F0U9_9NOCA
MTAVRDVIGRPWHVDSRTVVFGAVGAALYGALGIFSFILPGTANVAIRPALALVPFVGIRFGPVAGFFTGVVGTAITDQIQGFGFLTFWNWSLANGLIGVIASLLSHYLPEVKRKSFQAVRLAGLTFVAVAAGLAFTITEVLLGHTFVYWFTGAYLPAVATTATVSLLLVPVLDRAWQPLANRAGR